MTAEQFHALASEFAGAVARDHPVETDARLVTSLWFTFALMEAVGRILEERGLATGEQLRETFHEALADVTRRLAAPAAPPNQPKSRD